MRLARSLLLVFAFSCAGGAALLVHRLARPPAMQLGPVKPDMVDILVAARAVAVGEMVGKDQVRWQSWPREATPAGSLRRNADAPEANLPFEPAPARSALLEGEPLSPAKLVRAENGSPLAQLLLPGMRAISVPIREETSVGGSIQAGDHVDVIVTRKRGDTGQDAPHSETVLRSLRVLAVGKTVTGKASTLKTATLELTPGQARSLTAAQSAGEVSLSLIGTGDAGPTGGVLAAAGDPGADIRVMKYGRSAGRRSTQ